MNRARDPVKKNRSTLCEEKGKKDERVLKVQLQRPNLTLHVGYVIGCWKEREERRKKVQKGSATKQNLNLLVTWYFRRAS